MLLTFIGLVKFIVVFVFSVSNTKYHILCSVFLVSFSHHNWWDHMLIHEERDYSL